MSFELGDRDPLDFVRGARVAHGSAPLLGDGPLWLDADQKVVRTLRAAALRPDTPAARAWVRTLESCGAVLIVFQMLQLLEVFVRGGGCGDTASTGDVFAGVCSGLGFTVVLIGILVSARGVRRMLQHGTMRLLCAELTADVVAQHAEAARRRFWRAVAVASVVVASVLASMAVTVIAGTAQEVYLGGDDCYIFSISIHSWLAPPMFAVFVVATVGGLLALAVAGSLLVDATSALTLVFGSFSRRLAEPGGFESYDDALVEYLRLRALVLEQARQWELGTTAMAGSSVVYAGFNAVLVVLGYANFFMIAAPLLYVFFFSIGPVSVLSILRFNESLEDVMVGCTAAQAWTPAERIALADDVRRAPAHFEVYGVRIDTAVLATSLLGLASGVANLVFS